MRADKLHRAHVIETPEWGEQVVRDTATNDAGLIVIQLANGMDLTAEPHDDFKTVKP